MLAPRPLPFANERRFRLAAYLALAAQPVPRDTLAALFWPERPQTAANSNLRKLLMELRALDLPGLQADARTMAWPVASDAADLLHAAGSGNQGVDELIAGLAYAPPLQGLGSGDSPAFECWLADTRQALHRAWRAALLRRSQARLQQDAAAAAAGAERLLAQDPLDEDAARLLEAAWRALGRSADAERWRDTFALRLQQELGLRAAAGHPGSDGAVAPPADAPGLLGRAHDLLALRALLDDRRTRLVTVTGPGGVGKSALALALLREGGVDADGMLWVALEDLSDLAQVPLRIARELGVPASAAGDGWAEVRTALGRRQMLLVLDNAEHLPQLPAALQRLLGDVPTLRCVVTSRQRLGLAQELLLPLEPLDAQAASQLFLRGAQAAPWRRPIDAHDPLLPTLVDLLGRLPLALALAAAWTRHLQLPALVQQARQALDGLSLQDSPDEHPAHASLRATFNRSWQFLDAGGQAVLAALSVAVGDLAMDSACQVARADAAAIAALADASLLTISAQGRVGMHPLLRQFASGHLGDGPAREGARRRHAQALAARLAPWNDFDVTNGDAALQAIGPELSNALLAWDCAIELRQPGWLDAMTEALGHHYQSRGGVAQALPRFERALALLSEPGVAAPRALCRVALELASLRFWLADYAGVEQAARVALRAARAARLGRPKRQALNSLAMALMRLGRVDEGMVWLGQALASARQDGATHEAAVYAGNLCGLVRERGELDRAEALAQEALAGHRASGHAVATVSVLNELGLIAHQRERFDAAFDFQAQALVLADSHTMALRRPVMLTHQASARLDQGRLDEALTLALASLAQVQAVGARSHEPAMRRVLAEVLLALGRVEEALQQLRQAVQLQDPTLPSAGARGVLCSLAGLALARGQPQVAAYLHARAAQQRAPGSLMLPRYQRQRLRAEQALGEGQRVAVVQRAREDDAQALRACITDLLAP